MIGVFGRMNNERQVIVFVRFYFVVVPFGIQFPVGGKKRDGQFIVFNILSIWC